jgi:hypothetical protein
MARSFWIHARTKSLLDPDSAFSDIVSAQTQPRLTGAVQFTNTDNL